VFAFVVAAAAAAGTASNAVVRRLRVSHIMLPQASQTQLEQMEQQLTGEQMHDTHWLMWHRVG